MTALGVRILRGDDEPSELGIELQRAREQAIRVATHFIALCRDPGTPLADLATAAGATAEAAGRVSGFATLPPTP